MTTYPLVDTAFDLGLITFARYFSNGSEKSKQHTIELAKSDKRIAMFGVRVRMQKTGPAGWPVT